MNSGQIFVAFVIPLCGDGGLFGHDCERTGRETAGSQAAPRVEGTIREACQAQPAPRKDFMPLYFAYGANMDAAEMALRCPASRLIGRGRLNRHRFIIMKEGYASVVRAPGSTVWGVLWELSLSDVPALDRYEGVAGGLYVKATQPVTTEVGIRRALIYFGRSTAPGIPRPGYLENVLAAAQAAQLPGPYVQEIRGWLRRARA